VKESISIIFDENTIQRKVKDIALKINQDYISKSDILILSILKGSIVYTADLIRHFNFKFELEFLEISSYKNGKTSGDLSFPDQRLPEFANKHVIIVEDIIDTGKTLAYIQNLIRHSGALSLECTALLIKLEKDNGSLHIKYPGFNINDIFIVGYGMDYAGKYRNLPYIGALKH